MEYEKNELPPYSALAAPDWRRRWSVRRSRGLKFFALACLTFIAFAQWRQLGSQPGPRLSLERLQADLQICSKLRSKPSDPIGLGRERNARYVDGHKPTLIKNATVWVGEPTEWSSVEDARTGKGYSWITADILLEYGLIKQVGTDIDVRALPSDTLIWDAQGRPLTSGIIDMHSHAGVNSVPELNGNADTNELSDDITPYVRSIDGINVFDPQIQVIKSGGVTTSLVLPGSGNNIGGEAFVIKHAVGKSDGRNETSISDMLADPDGTWRHIKMACGENAKRIYGRVGEHGPYSRLGESWEFRHAFEQAASLVRFQNDWCDAAEYMGVARMSGYLPQDLKWETLGAVLRRQVHVHTHCYTVPDLEAFVDHTNEFKFPVRAFHHAHQTYLVPEVLKRAWGDSPPASALFADNMWYKAEAYIGSEYAGKVLYENGLTPIYVSDNPVLNAQHVVFEAAKAFGYGLPYHAALASVTSAPAERLGLEHRLGKIKPGFDADIVVWDSDPLSVGAAPVQVWIDGTAQFEDPIELKKPFNAPFDSTTETLAATEEEISVSDVVFTGVSHSFLSSKSQPAFTDGQNLTVAIAGGKITCIGTCTSELEVASQTGARVISLQNGYITKPFTVFGSTLGLNAIDAESDTDNGGSPDIFSRGIDGLAFQTKKLRYAHKYGVTRAISSPKYNGQNTHQGTSVGFRTSAKHVLEYGAIFADDAAVHYTLDLNAKSGSTSLSNAIGSLRHKLLEAVDANTTAPADPFTEAAFLAQVVDGSLPLAITVHSADGIAAVLRLKETVDSAIASSRGRNSGNSGGISVVVVGGAESHLVADELAAAGVGVVLSPFLAYGESWDQRRALTGAPLTNGTAVDALVRAGARVAVGIEEDWLVRDVGLLAGIAYKNGGGALSEGDALGLVSDNVYEILGLNVRGAGADAAGEFVVFEGSPLEVGARTRAVGGGLGDVALFV
ncbi:amidohydrolase [Xylariaceae sp. FL0662B]|nr:amidohydrolase [Xylariaceae sp. FL0662B]